MDAQQVDQAFGIAARFNGSQCRECRGNQTFGVVYNNTIVVTCETCGGDTPRGGITPQMLAPANVMAHRPVRRAQVRP